MNNATPLIGSIEEVKAGQRGPDVGAFFDLDGTLISGFSASHLTRDRIKNKELGLVHLGRTIGVAINASVGKAIFEDLLKIAAEAWKGRSNTELLEVGERLFRRTIVNLIYPEMKRMVKAHQEAGHTVVLSSSATAYQVEPVARFLGIDNIICNRFSSRDGALNGEIEKPVIWGKSKARAAQQFALENGLDLQNCYFYADGDEDVSLMYLVGHPRPVNPRKKLARVAEARGWPIKRYTSRKLNGRLRTLAGVASVVPIGLVGLGIGLLKRDKRAAINFVSPMWFETMFRINRVKLNVIGRENLWKVRPAVFIFNHRNNFDALMMAQLVERDFTGVGKKELKDHWLTGTVGKLADVAFIDRPESDSSTEALEPLAELGRKGLSISLSPEGTRNDTDTVGPFKKGIFRMALATGLPIVPIVFRNADSIAARDSAIMSPGTVDVAVLAPIDTSDWTLNNLSRRSEEVRQLYIDTLQNWPTAEEISG